MLVYLADDRGARGEYAHFLKAYGSLLPAIDLEVFSHWYGLEEAMLRCVPDIILLDMRFDETPTALLYGDIENVAASERFCGDLKLAEAQIRESQGLLLVRAIRESGVQAPIILFASLPPKQRERLLNYAAPIYIIEGLILEELQNALKNTL